MENGMTLSAVELFFLGRCMGAKYIDYAYIAAMPGIQQRFALHERQALEALEELGLIEEDFSGDVEVTEEAEKLFRPVFFGDVESRLESGGDYRIHILDGAMTLGEMEEEEICFRRVTDSDIEGLLQGNVRVQCAKADVGFYEKAFTAGQMKERGCVREALQILKGEIDDGLL